MASVTVKSWSGLLRTEPVENYIEASTGSDREGMIESASEQADNVAYALGRLVDALVEKGLLCQTDIERIAGKDAPGITELRRDSNVDTQEV